jgi:hypothetical protein
MKHLHELLPCYMVMCDKDQMRGAENTAGTQGKDGGRNDIPSGMVFLK